LYPRFGHTLKNQEMSPIVLTTLAMVAFAANSILCRMALGADTIDAASFTSIRLISGAVMLAGILFYRDHGLKQERLNPISTLMLFGYALCFSFSYIELSAGTGALILFGAVQLTIILFGSAMGERHGRTTWIGIIAAFGGLAYLLTPSVSAPPPISALLMALAGIAWGIYTIRGKASVNPLSTTGWNFIATIPLSVLAYLFFRSDAHLTSKGVTLAILSGTLASGIGYVIWYSALPSLSRTTAATVQLSVPVIAAFGGVLLLSEPVTLRLLIASLVVLGGIYLTIKSSAPK
jgi:drug/metabolite transporter (DMT)-like permease